jgi:hypothetical protein
MYSRSPEEVGNKNAFILLCEALGLPTLPTLMITDGTRTGAGGGLVPAWPCIVKPAKDRVQLDDIRRRFFVAHTSCELDAFLWTDDGRAVVESEYQIQAYVDYHTHEVAYYNYTFVIGASVKPRLLTRQLLNLSAIHQNRDALHWGNACVDLDSAICAGMAFCERLAKHYSESGYRGEIGIDFGVADGAPFLLETNARENNGTRLHRFLEEKGWPPAGYAFAFLRNIPFRLVLERMGAEADAVLPFVVDTGDRKLVLSEDPAPVRVLLRAIDQMAREVPPVNY